MAISIVNDDSLRSVPNPSIVALDARLVGGSSTGDSTYWTGLLHGLSRLPDGPRIVLFSNADRPQNIPWCDRFEWRRLPAKSGRWWSLVRFPLAARRLGAGAIHTQYTLSPLAGPRGVTTVHDVSFLLGPEWFRAKDRFILSRTVPASCRRAARVITVSETSRGEIEREISASRGKVRVTRLACPPWIQPIERVAARERVRAELGLDHPYVLTVGTRWPRKNMGLAVEAASRLPADLPHRLIVTGKSGWGEQELGERGIASGYVDNEMLSCLYSGAELYLAPSRHEGFGIPVLEAFRTGCPVLCSSGGAFPEVAGDAAVVERSWDAADWARRMEELLRDPGTLDALRDRGHDRERMFTWEETARRTLDVYREVAK
jgi:glycosyltransferase involved in cell wall biosynthesis